MTESQPKNRASLISILEQANDICNQTTPGFDGIVGEQHHMRPATVISSSSNSSSLANNFLFTKTNESTGDKAAKKEKDSIKKETPKDSANKGEKKKKRTWTKAKDRPKRPLSAYNLFFQHERERIISPDAAAAVDAEEISLATGVDFSTPDEHSSSDNKMNSQYDPKPKKRRHRKTHGKISFTELARSIGKKWKELDQETRSVFEARAKVEKDAYLIKLEEWKKKKQDEEEQEKVKAEAAVATCTVPEDEQNDDDNDDNVIDIFDDVIQDAQNSQTQDCTNPFKMQDNLVSNFAASAMPPQFHDNSLMSFLGFNINNGRQPQSQQQQVPQQQAEVPHYPSQFKQFNPLLRNNQGCASIPKQLNTLEMALQSSLNLNRYPETATAQPSLIDTAVVQAPSHTQGIKNPFAQQQPMSLSSAVMSSAAMSSPLPLTTPEYQQQPDGTTPFLDDDEEEWKNSFIYNQRHNTGTLNPDVTTSFHNDDNNSGTLAATLPSHQQEKFEQSADDLEQIAFGYAL